MGQFFVHGVVVNTKMKRLYNPGLAAVVFLHIPIGIYYIWYVVSNSLVSTSDWVFGVIATVIAAILLIALPLKVLANKQSRYPWSKNEMERFDVAGKLKSKGLR
jgi:membrane protein YdbS with pleckstrin-like domain